MRFRYLVTATLVVLTSASLGFADGMIYQLPSDGAWAKFAMEGVFLDSAGKPSAANANVTGTLTISSVGTVKQQDVTCRWIEIVIEAQRDGKSFKEVDKLLIPESELGAGKQPLKHVRDAWYMHSLIDDGKPRHIENIDKMDVVYVQRIRPILHPPFTEQKPLGQVEVECKLGKVTCEGVTAQETEKRDGSDIEYFSSYTICLHDKAPFGVAAWQAVNRVRRADELLGTMKLQATLIDFGQGAKSCIASQEP